MAWWQTGSKPLYEPMLDYYQLEPNHETSVNENATILIQVNKIENVICKMVANFTWVSMLRSLSYIEAEVMFFLAD